MFVINMYNHPMSVKIKAPYGPDFIHLVSKGRVHLTPGFEVDANWLAEHDRIKIVVISDPVPAPITEGDKV